MSLSEADGVMISGQGGRPSESSINNTKEVPVVDTSMTVMGPLVEGAATGNNDIETETGNARVQLPGQNESSTKLSFRDTLLGRSGASTGSPSISELDVEVLDEDVRIGGGNGMLEIWFSDRVHDAIDAKLEKSMIIRLLDKAIG
ncbi:hypothetical protein V6N13_071570 [Hibiscus sabdariffa]